LVYDLASGKRVRERRQDSLESGGKAVGNDDERWLRRIERTFDVKTGKVVSEDYYRHGTIVQSPGASRSAWIKIGKQK
jgi:hypothetical protein